MKLTSKNTRGKLTMEQAEDVRRQSAAGVTNKDIAKQYGVSDTVISRIKLNLCYRIPKCKSEVTV